VL
ncbi:ABC transporter for multidrug domain protein, partial [Chlamydia psittaci 84-8471/1]|jgi:structural maintenance of chromosome 3 (chondroitin sulfate proteoglycan 6)